MNFFPVKNRQTEFFYSVVGIFLEYACISIYIVYECVCVSVCLCFTASPNWPVGPMDLIFFMSTETVCEKPLFWKSRSKVERQGPKSGMFYIVGKFQTPGFYTFQDMNFLLV